MHTTIALATAAAAAAAAAAAGGVAAEPAPPSPAVVPPLARPFMGWMAWDQFRCSVNCNATAPTGCVNLRLFTDHARLMAEGGYLAAGYSRVHLDDCGVARARDNVTGVLPLDPVRFPGDLAALSAGVAAWGVGLGVYTAISATTCEGYPGSRGYEAVDAAHWAANNVTAVKADGCGDPTYFPVGYPLLGAALAAQPPGGGTQPLMYSCSWPAYDGAVETSKNWSAYAAAGCVTGRTYADMQCAWDSPPPLGGTPLRPILDHYGNYSGYLQAVTAATGFVMDGDQLVAGATNPDTGGPCFTVDEEATQLALWAVLALPLVMGNDLRIIRPESAALLLNARVIAVNQDGVVGGRRLSPLGRQEVWARNLTNGSVAVALFNKEGPPQPPPAPCVDWTATGPGWYYEAGVPCGSPDGNDGCYDATVPLADALATCCGDPGCAGVTFDAAHGTGGCYKTGVTCPVNATGTMGFYKPGWAPPAPPPPGAGAANVTVSWGDLGLPPGARATVTDVWSGQPAGDTGGAPVAGGYTAVDVPLHGTAFVLVTLV
jgi:alpha-galactosidase